MTNFVSRSTVIAAINNNVADNELRTAAIQAINKAYVNEHMASLDDDQSAFLNLVLHYDELHRHNPENYNPQRIVVEACRAFLY